MRSFEVSFCLSKALEKGDTGVSAAESNANQAENDPFRLDANTPLLSHYSS